MRLKYFAAISLLLFSSAFACANPASPLVITKGGTYSGNFTSVTIAGTDGKLITVSNSTITGGITQTTTTPIFISIEKCTLTTTPGKENVTLWRVTNLDIEQCDFHVGGVLIGNFGSGISASIRANRFYGIDGTVAKGQVVKVAGISVQHWHGSFNIAFNEFWDSPGTVCEDHISAMQSTGLSATQLFVIHDNFISATASDSTSGSGIVFDPGMLPVGDPAAQGPLWILCHSNVICNEPNQAVSAAYGGGYTIQNNLSVNSAIVGGWGIQAFNWRNVTTTEHLGRGVVISGNESCCITSRGQRRDYSFSPPIASANNTSITVTDTYALDLWDARKTANHVSPGNTK